jgi:hypothetical protein
MARLTTPASPSPAVRRILPVALAMALAACGSNDPAQNTIVVPPIAAPAPSPTPTPTPGPATFNVAPCLNQVVPGTGGATVASLVVPDVLTLDLNSSAGFPNGRRLPDPVIDITLAVLFLDLRTHPADTLARVPVNPPANDLPFRANFPYLAAPQGTPPISGTAGTDFNFRTEPPNAFTRVDRTGKPAVAPALIGGPLRNSYNDTGLSDDIAGLFVPEITAQLTALTNALADDFGTLRLTMCATPR